MGSTPNRSLPYPEITDQRREGANQIKALALALDAILGADSGWVDITVGTGWAIGDAPRKPQVRKYMGRIYYKGFVTVQAGATTALGTIPDGFRPVPTTFNEHHFPVACSSGPTMVYTAASGALSVSAVPVQGAWVDLSSIHYFANP